MNLLVRRAPALLLTLIGTLASAQGHPEYRDEVVRLQVGFAGSTDLLREEQVDALIGILRNADQEFQRARPTGADYTNATAEKWERLQATTLHLIQQRDQRIRHLAAALLTPAQYASLDARIRRERGGDELLRIAAQIVPLGKAGVTRHPPGTPGPFLIGVNDDMLVKDGEYRNAWIRQARREVEATYVDVPQVLKLSPQLTDELFSLLVGQQLARLDNPAGPYAAWTDRLLKEEREIMALLGERNAVRFSEFRETFGYRFRVRHLRVAIGAGPDALRPEQVEALIAVYRDADQQTTHGNEFRCQRDARIREAAAAFLTPPQLVALDAWLERKPG